MHNKYQYYKPGMLCKNIIAIGSTPSSGSTLLADLIDSQPLYTCGSETAILAAMSLIKERDLTQLTKLKAHISKDISVPFLGINWDGLCEYGINKSILQQLCLLSKSKENLLEIISQRYFALRGKPLDSVFFEKTPLNVAYASSIIKLSNIAGFLFIVRNPYYVVTSMLRRGFPSSLAISAWLQHCSLIHNLKNTSKNVLEIRYEDLVAHPVNTLIMAISALGIKPGWQNQELIIQNYTTSLYRKLVSQRTLDTWKRNEYGKISSANCGINQEAIEVINEYKYLRLSKTAKEYFNLEETPSLDYFIDFYSYSDTLEIEPVILPKTPEDQISPKKLMMKLKLHAASARNLVRSINFDSQESARVSSLRSRMFEM